MGGMPGPWRQSSGWGRARGAGGSLEMEAPACATHMEVQHDGGGIGEARVWPNRRERRGQQPSGKRGEYQRTMSLQVKFLLDVGDIVLLIAVHPIDEARRASQSLFGDHYRQRHLYVSSNTSFVHLDCSDEQRGTLTRRPV